MIDVVQAVVESKIKKIKQWPTNSNRASIMGHPCDRFLVYKRTRWQEEALHDVGRQFVFDEGNLHEEAVLQALREAGFKIIEQQRPFEWKKYQITGTVDAKILDDRKAYPIEVKSFSEWAWNKTNTVDDMLKSKAVYMRGYPAQLTLYLLMDEKEEGMFILKNKTNGLLKQINLTLDFEYAETLVKKAERINAHLQAGTLPDRIPWEVGACEWCSFGHICLPEYTREATLLDDPELEAKLDRRGELKALSDEYDALDKEIKEKVKERPETVVGKWLLKGAWRERKAFTVEASRYWQTNIKEIR